MKFRLRLKGSKTSLLVNKKSLENLDIFRKAIEKYNCFEELPDSTVNLKYSYLGNVSKADEVFEKVRFSYYCDLKFKDKK